MKRKHAQPNVESMKENPKNHQFTENGLMLRHPFTMMVAASTGGGKTWLVKNLLENRQQWISPAPQRIIWIYGQWQPLYVEMQRIIPGIEFVKGIPANIEDEQFLNPAIRNLIVIDDLMSETSNDKRICDLFTKGSHHRNLSDMSGAEFILPGERKSHHELKQSVFSVIQQPKGPTTSHGLGKTDVSRSE